MNPRTPPYSIDSDNDPDGPLPTFSEMARRPGVYFGRLGRGLRRSWNGSDTRPITGALLGVAVLLVGLLAYWIVLAAQLPSLSELRKANFSQASIVYSADGVVLARYQDENRTWVGLDSISTHVVEALLATEDHRFYQHWGVDFRRLVSSTLQTLKGDMQGGSTLTMQFARNAFPDMADDMALTRKVKEWITALRTEGLYEKDEILEMYLNTVPFMYNAFGIEAAAQTYFQKHASDLTVKESATLVGMLKGTVYYNPVRNPERSHERRNVVLQQMVKHGYLTPEEYQTLEEQPTKLRFHRMTHEDNLAPYFAEYLREWLDEWAEGRGYNLYTDGLRIHTTIDAKLQEAATEAVEKMGDELQAVAAVEWSGSRPRYFSGQASAYKSYHDRVAPFSYFWEANADLLEARIRRSERFERLGEGGLAPDSAFLKVRADTAVVDSIKSSVTRLEAGFVAIEPGTGAVKAWVGGRNFKEDRYDHVALAKRQPGSTFKPFVYAAALEKGYTPNDVLRDQVMEYVNPETNKRWSPKNVGGSSGELITLAEALAQSKNTVTAQLVMDVGPKQVVDVARRAGIQSELSSVPSIGLGTSEVSLLELSAAYTAFVNGGTVNEPLLVSRIEDNRGYVIQSFSTTSRQALSAGTAYGVLDMMRGVVDRGTGRRIRSVFGVQGDLAGKTGTTQNSTDGWFMLVHPNLVMGSWVGFNAQAVRFRSNYWGQGAHNALYIVGEFMRRVKLPPGEFAAPRSYDPGRSSRRDTVLLVEERDWQSQWDALNEDAEEFDFSDDSYLTVDEGERSDERDAFDRGLPDDEVEIQDEEVEIDQEDEPAPRASSAADSLNRLERRRSPVSDYLEQIRKRDN